MTRIQLPRFNDSSIQQLPLSLYNPVEHPDIKLINFIENHESQQPSGLTEHFLEAAEAIFNRRIADISQISAVLGRLARIAPRNILGCPVITVEEDDGWMRIRPDLFFVDSMRINRSHGAKYLCSPCRPYGYAGYNCRHALIGYDIEYRDHERTPEPDESKGIVTTSRRMISHQFYFGIGLEHACIVLITKRRFTQKALVREFIANALPDTMITYDQLPSGESAIKKVPITKVYICSHFSLAEAGMLIPSFDKITRADEKTGEEAVFQKPLIECKKKQWCGKARIRDRQKKVKIEHWIDGSWVSEEELKRRNRKRRRLPALVPMVVSPGSVIEDEISCRETVPGVWLYFADSINLVIGSLKKAGEIIGLYKCDVGDHISQMDQLWLCEPLRFLEYAARDAVVTAQVISYYAQAFSPLTGGELATRVARYSEIHFKNFFQKLYGENKTFEQTCEQVPMCVDTGKQLRVSGRSWKRAMGFQEITKNRDDDGRGLEGLIRCVVADDYGGKLPTTIDGLVDYVIDQREQQLRRTLK